MVDGTVGQRIKYYRTRAGKTRAVVGGLVGRSAEWVKAVENDRLLPPRLPMLSRLAKILGVDIADLVGHLDIPEDVLSGPGHEALPAVRDAINRYPLHDEAEPHQLEHVEARIAAAWRARHASADHRTVLGQLLPALITDTQRVVRAATGDDRRHAQAMLSNVLGLTQMFVAYQPDAPLLWRVADRAMIAAAEADTPRAIAAAAWFLVEAHREAGDWDTALAVNTDALRLVEPYLSDADDDLLGLWGALQTTAALTAARAGEAGRALRHLDLAERVTQRLPSGAIQRWTWFSRPVVGFYAVSIAVELQRGGEAVRAARKVDPSAITSTPRRARHLVEVARAHRLRRDQAATMQALSDAMSTAPETVRYNASARQMTAELQRGEPSLRRAARELAMRVGVPV